MAPVADNEVAVVDNNIDLLYTSVFTQVHALEEDLYIAGTSFGDLLVYEWVLCVYIFLLLMTDLNCQAII